MTRKELGRIQDIRIGHYGYQEAMLGVQFTLGGDGWGVGDFWGSWAPSLIKHSEHTKWTEAERVTGIADAFIRLDASMKRAKVSDAMKLKNIPVEVEFDGTTLKSWRVLTEVL